MEEQRFINSIDEFDIEKQKIARLGIASVLTVDQVSVFYQPNYNAEQMIIAERAFELGVSTENVEFFYRQEFIAEKMLRALWGFISRLTKEQVACFYKLEYGTATMWEICNRLLLGETPNFITWEMNLPESCKLFASMHKKMCTSKEVMQFVVRPEFNDLQMCAAAGFEFHSIQGLMEEYWSYIVCNFRLRGMKCFYVLKSIKTSLGRRLPES